MRRIQFDMQCPHCGNVFTRKVPLPEPLENENGVTAFDKAGDVVLCDVDFGGCGSHIALQYTLRPIWRAWAIKEKPDREGIEP